MSPQKPLFTGAVKIKLAQRYSKTFIQYSGSARRIALAMPCDASAFKRLW